jgi:oligopeptidase B
MNVYAGGGEMGRSWYEDEGKYLKKMNTFQDFIDCAHYLVDEQITSRDQLAIVGRSAGGLLVGAVCNLSPQSFKAAVADVPFVDVMNSMSDPTIPLTVTEWEEWGKTDSIHKDDFHSVMMTLLI